MKAKILQNRGTESSVSEISEAMWSGKNFVKYSQEKLANLSPEAKIIIQHGTTSIKVGDYPKSSRVIPESGIRITTGKGTGTIQL